MKSTRLPHYLYTASLFLLILLTAVCIAISAADVSIQALADKTTTGKFDFRNLVVVGGSYVLLALASLIFSCSRMLSIRRSMQNIPKIHIPIKKNDVCEKVYLKIKHEFEQVKSIKQNTIPRHEDIQAVGWAKPGTPLFEGLDFKQAIARTPAIVESVAINIDPSYKRPLYCPVRQYIEFLIREGLVDKQLGTTYVEGYEIARFSRDPLSQQQYIDIMKHLAAILQNMGYNIKANQQTNAETESMMSSHRTGSSSNRSFRLYNLVSRTNRPHSAADDAISVTPSLNTWASQPQHMLMGDNEDDDDYSAYDEDEVRHDIYELLTRDKMHA
ncbi:hypothetical protein G6F61_001307 [Rhizopus arrhizus]|uniref:Defect at low temperature protein 1 n=1 Tax=Rhizopus oryzae TaxID=64495 RepID=A0A9P6XHV1_RHIOR|nr:hypothetical protein G6F64_001753 [Rhizopus arrhizus]KAG1383505.1 hypothetical protein G6F61_001307 [Rhizopus arrhizus]